MTAEYPDDIKIFDVFVDGVDRVLAEHPNALGEEVTAIETWLFRALALGTHVDSHTLSANLTLVDGDKAIQKVDCNGAARDVTLPAVATTNHVFYVVNVSAGAFNITVKNAGGSTIATVVPGQAAIIIPTAAAWYGMGGISATATPTASRIPISLANGYLDGWVSAAPSGMRNGKIKITVVNNDLVLEVKTLADADPSPTDPVYVRIKGVDRVITAALSSTAVDATNWAGLGNPETAAIEQDLFAYLIWNTGPATDIVDVAWSRYPSGCVYSDFSGTSTNEKYLKYGNATAPNSTDDLVLIGRFAATLSAAAGHVWTVPTFTSENLIQFPIRESRWRDWSPAMTGWTTPPTGGVYQYKIYGDLVFHLVRQPNTAASNATTTTLTSPITPVTLTNAIWGAPCSADDNSVVLSAASLGQLSSGSNVINYYKTMDVGATAWTGGGNKRIRNHEFFFRW